MTVDWGKHEERIRRLIPLHRLPHTVREEVLARAASLVTLEPNDHVYLQGEKDEHVNYLLSGRVGRIVDGVVLDTLDADRDARTRPLDETARKRDTVRALSPVTILRIERRELEDAYRRFSGELTDDNLEVLDISSDTSTDWHTRLLRSDVFMRLSASAIQGIFGRMEAIDVAAGEEVVRQGEWGSYYYIIQSGLCQVMRKPSGDGAEILLAVLEPGEGFGEEALISGAPRNATVRVLRAGKLMRMRKPDFLGLVVKPLVHGVSAAQAKWLVEQGATWIDARDWAGTDGHGVGAAIRMPLHLLRVQSRSLDKAKTYVVCGEDMQKTVLATFMLAARGLDVAYLERPLTQVDLEMNEMEKTSGGNGPDPTPVESDERVAREAFAGTTTGEELADLIDELYRQRQALAADNDPPAVEEQVAENTPDETPAEPGPPAAATDAASESGDDPPDRADNVIDMGADKVVDEIFRSIESGLTQYIAECLDRQRSELQAHVQQRLARLEDMAKERVEAYERELSERFHSAHEEKEKKLAESYDRLTALANRISRQKADIQKARKALESMLRTASRVHREVYRVGNALVDQIDHLNLHEDDINVH